MMLGQGETGMFFDVFGAISAGMHLEYFDTRDWTLILTKIHRVQMPETRMCKTRGNNMQLGPRVEQHGGPPRRQRNF